MDDETLLNLTADIVSAHVSHNSVAMNDLAGLVQQVHSALAGLGQPADAASEPKVPVVSVAFSEELELAPVLEPGPNKRPEQELSAVQQSSRMVLSAVPPPSRKTLVSSSKA